MFPAAESLSFHRPLAMGRTTHGPHVFLQRNAMQVPMWNHVDYGSVNKHDYD